MPKFETTIPNRSDKYQYLICEVNYSYELLSSFSNSQNLHNNDQQQYLELKDLLFIKTMEIAEQVMTPRQWEIFKMYLDGKTQVEIASHFGVNQSSITKSLNGNIDYTRKLNKDGTHTIFGGSTKKLIKACKTNPEIQKILDAMDELRE